MNGTVTSFDYDDQNRMITATTADHVIHYEYDADGIRTEKTVDNVTTVYLVDHQTAYPQVLEERTDSGSLIAAYTIGNDLISMRRGGVDSYYHYDGLGSTRELTDAAGLVTDTYDFEAFGEKIASTGSTQNAFLFTGEQYDPGVGFYYLRARFYNPLVGRFMTMDEWEGNLVRPLTLNKYLYADGNPTTFVDPSGYFSLMELNITTAIRGILSTIATPSFSGVKAYISFEILCSTYDLFDASFAIMDPNASKFDQGAALTLFMLGMVMPGSASWIDDIRTPDGRRITKHALEHFIDRGFSRISQLDEIIDGATFVTKQADGATVFIRERLKNGAKRWDVIIEGDKGIVTAIWNLNEVRKVRALARNYRWEDIF